MTKPKLQQVSSYLRCYIVDKKVIESNIDAKPNQVPFPLTIKFQLFSILTITSANTYVTTTMSTTL